MAAAVMLSGMLTARGAPAVELAAPYVPTAPSVVERMLEVARVGPKDYVIDLGSGDGRIVITAAKKHGARGLGIEIDPKLVALAKANAQAAGVAGHVHFEEADLFAADLSKASVVTIYLLTRATIKLRTRLFGLKPGTRVVTNASSMGDWKPDHFEMMEVKDKVRPDAPKNTYIQLWIVPAKVAGIWRWTQPAGDETEDYELELTQHFQEIAGKIRFRNREVAIGEARIQAERISLSFSANNGEGVAEYRLVGSVSGDVIAGTTTIASHDGKRRLSWNARRVADAASR